MSNNILIGVDECGWGSIAGPFIVCAAAAYAKDLPKITARDSKRYQNNVAKMSKAVSVNKQYVIASHIITFDPERLCGLGYESAKRYAFKAAVHCLRRTLAPRFPPAIIDGADSFSIPYASSMVKADDKCRIVSYASVVGKLQQKLHMAVAHRLCPEYKFLNNAGYGTKDHLSAIEKHGAIAGFHRMRVVAQMFKNRGLNLFPRDDVKGFIKSKHSHQRKDK